MRGLGYWFSAALLLGSVPLACFGGDPNEPLAEELLAAAGMIGAAGAAQGGAGGAAECELDADCGPDDGNPCTKPNHCNSGSCVVENELPGTACDDGVDCTENDSCDGSGVCTPGTPNDYRCRPDYCTDDDQTGVGCCAEYTCSTAGCSHTPIMPGYFVCRKVVTGDRCDEPELCDGTDTCPPDGVKAGGTVCLPGACYPSNDGYSAFPEVRCDGQNKGCALPGPAECGAFVCNADATSCRTTCSNNAHCRTGAYCDVPSSTCLPRTDVGRPCDGNAECAVGSTCVDGVCCDTDCDGQCEACDVRGHAGVCTPFAGDPRDHDREACAGDGTLCAGSCNGVRRSSCAYPDDGTRCADPSCDPAENVAVDTSYCDGAGRCRRERVESCAPYVCAGDGCGDDCSSDGECEGDTYCRSGRCVPRLEDGEDCTRGAQCASGFCADSVCCESACTGQCEACDARGSEGSCRAISGDPVGDRPACAGSGLCAGACDGSRSDACTYPSAEVECRAASCSGGAALLASSCDGGGNCPESLAIACMKGCEGPVCAGDQCVIDADCDDPSLYCAAGLCRPLGRPGASCTDTAQCSTGYCVDGVCCEEACLGQCEACDVAGSSGICSAVPEGSTPRGGRMPCASDGSECGGTCDGERRDGCAYPTDVVCREPSCEGGANDAVAIAEARCTGSGRCPERVERSCVGLGCTSDGTLCNGPCADDDDACPGGSYCSAGVCVPELPPGEPCGADAECATGFCTDGVCCDARCDGTCEACDVGGDVGSCRALEGAPRGGRPACRGSGICGARCDGTSRVACEYTPPGTSCGSAVCGHGTRAESQSCDGAGRCVESERMQCPAFECDGSDCGTACLLDEDCTGDYVCNDRTCMVNPLVDAIDRGNCGCRVPGPRGAGGGVAVAIAAALGLALGRRRATRARGRAAS